MSPRRSARVAAISANQEAQSETASETTPQPPAKRRRLNTSTPAQRKTTVTRPSSAKPKVESSTKQALAARVQAAKTANVDKPFIKLPGEICNEMYILAVSDSIPDSKPSFRDREATDRLKALLSLPPPFIVSCKQIHGECQTLFNPKTIQMYDPMAKEYDNLARPGRQLLGRRLLKDLEGIFRWNANEHKSVQEVKSTWQGLLRAAPHFNYVGIVTFDSALASETFWFAGQGPFTFGMRL